MLLSLRAIVHMGYCPSGLMPQWAFILVVSCPRQLLSYRLIGLLFLWAIAPVVYCPRGLLCQWAIYCFTSEKGVFNPFPNNKF